MALTRRSFVDYDYILVNSSGGKDSQVMLGAVHGVAEACGVHDRMVVVHADLGKVEWQGTKQLAREQADRYGVRFETVAYRGCKGKDLLDYVRARKKWPDSKNRYCTSDFKRGPVDTFITRLYEEWKQTWPNNKPMRRMRVLNCLGMRSQESPARSKLKEFVGAEELTKQGLVNARKYNSRREVDTWHPILHLTEDEVWRRITKSGVPYHHAYDLGMPRLSCMFCVFAPKAALMIAGKANPELLAEYVAVEKEIGHTFRKDFRIEEVQEAIAAGVVVEPVKTWNM